MMLTLKILYVATLKIQLFSRFEISWDTFLRFLSYNTEIGKSDQGKGNRDDKSNVFADKSTLSIFGNVATHHFADRSLEHALLQGNKCKLANTISARLERESSLRTEVNNKISLCDVIGWFAVVRATQEPGRDISVVSYGQWAFFPVSRAQGSAFTLISALSRNSCKADFS